MKVFLKRSTVAAAIVLAGALGGCGAVQEGTVFKQEFWERKGANEYAELGLAELAKGNYVQAEASFQRAMKANENDIHALLGLGIIYQNTGQTAKAKQMYQRVLAIGPDATEQFVVWNTLKTQPISDVASVNLALLESGGVPVAQQSMRPGDGAPEPMMGGVTGAPTADAMMGRPMPVSSGDGNMRIVQPAPGDPTGASAGFDETFANVVSRFVTLKVLRDQGLMTAAEYKARREANVGALLPLTSPPPAAGLDRTVPGTEQVAGRLRAIGRALEMRALTVSQHASERQMILDGLMPAAPVMVAGTAAPPSGLMEAADAVRRLEKLKTIGVISSDEYGAERAAIESAMRTIPGDTMPAQMKSEVESDKMSDAPKQMSGPQPAVHLASYRSQDAAEKGWAQLRKAHSALLGNLTSQIAKVNLGPGKGTYFRLKAGPVKDAAETCRQLKARRQFCEATFMKL